MLNLSHFHVNGTVQTKQGRLVGVTHTRTTHMVGVRKGLGSDGLWPFHFWSPGHFPTQRARNNCLQWPWNYIHLGLHCMKVVSLFPLRVLWAFSSCSCCHCWYNQLVEGILTVLFYCYLPFCLSLFQPFPRSQPKRTLNVRRGPHQLRC